MESSSGTLLDVTFKQPSLTLNIYPAIFIYALAGDVRNHNALVTDFLFNHSTRNGI